MPFVHIESYNGKIKQKLNKWEKDNPKASIEFLSHCAIMSGVKIYQSCIIKTK